MIGDIVKNSRLLLLFEKPRLPSPSQSIITLWPVPTYTVAQQKHAC